MKMYAEINTNQHKGIFKVVEIVGGIVAVNINGTTYDCYLKNGEIARFTDEKGNNLIQR